MKISRLEAIPFALPLREVVRFSTGQLSALEHVLLRIHTDDGLVGQAEAPARPMVYGESAKSIVAALLDWFAPMLVGLDPFARAQIQRRLDTVEHNPTAKGAVDIALHDLIGQATGTALWRLMGGWTSEVRLSHILGLGAPEAVAEQALRLREAYGFTAFKLKAGIEPARDTAMIAAVRRALGPDVLLHVDANHGYSSQVAARILPQWEAHDVAWVEEPCPGFDQRGRALVAQATRIPLMADESAITPDQVMAEIRHGACRLISIKTARTGFGPSTRILHLCDANGLQPVIGSQGDSDVGALASAHFYGAHRSVTQHPAELTFFLDAADHLLVEPPAIANGRFTLPDRPGLGLQIDDAKLARYRLDS